MKKISLYAWFGGNVSIFERFRIIKKVGFDSVSLYWGDDYPEITGNKYDVVQMVKKQFQLEVENIHAPYNHADDLFSDDEQKAKAVLQTYIQCIHDAAQYDIPVVVFHLTGDHPNLPLKQEYLGRIQYLVHAALNYRVKIAFENLTDKGYSYLEKVLEIYQEEVVGFCYDAGHDYIYSQTPFSFLKKYQKRLFAMHLHGNNGKNDSHQRIVDGSMDWTKLKAVLNSISFSCPIALEVIQNLHFEQLCDFEKYVKDLKKDCLFFLK